MRDIYAEQDFHKNPVHNVVIESLAEAPDTGVSIAGQLYFDTNSNQLFLFDGSVWTVFETGGDSVTSVNGQTGAVVLDFDDVGAVGKDTVFFNVKDHGAVGNDTAIDTTAIQNTINAANAAGGGIVFLPKGTYKINAVLTLHEGVSIWGASQDDSIIHQSSTSARAIQLTNGASETVASLTLQGFTVTGPGTGSGVGIYIEGRPLDYLKMANIVANGFGSHGVQVKGAIVSNLEGVIASNNGAIGIFVDGTDSFVTSVAMLNCYGNNNGTIGVMVKKSTYVGVMAGAADSNPIGYHFLDCFALSVNGTGAESNDTDSYRIEGSGTFGSNGVNMVGCYSYDVGGVGFNILGFAVGVNLIGCHDNAPAVGATNSVHIDSTASACDIGSTFANPIDADGAWTRPFVAEDGRSALRIVEMLRIHDVNGKAVLDINSVANAVNGFAITNAATGQAPLFGASGSDANIPLYLASKGTGDIRITSDIGEVFLNITFVDNAVNSFYMQPSITGQAPLFGVQGTDTDIPLYLQSKGNGDVRLAHNGGDLVANFTSIDSTPVNYPLFTAVNSGQAVGIGVAGADTDIYLDLQSKGAGVVRANGRAVATDNNALAFSNKTFPAGVVIPGTSGTLRITADSDGGEYNIGVDTTGTLALYGSGGASLSLHMLDGDVDISDTTRGLILTAPNSTRYRVQVSNAGALTVTAI